MKTFNYLNALLLSVLVFWGCSKKSDDNPSPVSSVPECLVKYVSDGSDSSVYVYKNNGLIDSVILYTGSTLYVTKPTYNSNGQYLTIYDSYYSTTYTMTYDNGKLKTISDGYATITVSYDVNNNPVSAISDQSSFPSISNIVYQNGNVKSWTQPNSRIDDGYIDISATFDGKVNIKKQLIPDPYNITEYFNTNNLTSAYCTSQETISGHDIGSNLIVMERKNFTYFKNNPVKYREVYYAPFNYDYYNDINVGYTCQ
jgi:hypothetical protein